MDRNHDGFITKGELRLAHKDMAMQEINHAIQQYDTNKDGKLNVDEFTQ